MLRLKQQLKNLLKPLAGVREGAARVAVLGIGSELRGDDAAGLLVLKHLQKKINISRRAAARRRAARLHRLCRRHCGQVCSEIRRPLTSRGPTLRLFKGGTAPENLTGEIRRFHPSHLIMIDAAQLDRKPGNLAVIEPDDPAAPLLTHRLPIKLMLDYLAHELLFAPLIIGIQPQRLDCGAVVSRAVARSCERLAGMIWSAQANLSYQTGKP